MSGSALVVRGNALHLPLPDASVDLIVSSPPYFALRSYRDGDEHYAGQLGSEPTPQAFLEALWAVMHECWRVLKPSGSCFINLGDKRSGSGGHNNNGLGSSTLNGHGGKGTGRDQGVKRTTREGVAATRRNAPDRYNQAAFGRPKSKMLLPHRFAIGCEDGLADPEGKGWVVRSDIVWQKLNGLPESVTDRVRDSHEWLFALTKQDDAYGWPDDDKEMLFHLTKSERYFAAVDEVRENYSERVEERQTYSGRKGAIPPAKPNPNRNDGGGAFGILGFGHAGANPLGKLPGSVWALPSEPLIISDEVKAHYDLPDHFAAFPTELVRRVILGWSPSGICVECGEGRRPVVAKTFNALRPPQSNARRRMELHDDELRAEDNHFGGPVKIPGETQATITGYACRCTPRTSHRGKRGDWKEGREVMPEHGSDDFTESGNAVPRRPGGFGTKVPRSEGQWEYHLDDWTSPPTSPAVVLDIFGGTGTTAGVARALGRTGISVDLSHDYSRLARWRIERSGHFAKAVTRTHKENQGALL